MLWSANHSIAQKYVADHLSSRLRSVTGRSIVSLLGNVHPPIARQITLTTVRLSCSTDHFYLCGDVSDGSHGLGHRHYFCGSKGHSFLRVPYDASMRIYSR